MAVLIFEGADASGKDILKTTIEKSGDYSHTCVMRFGFSQLVYGAYFKRPIWTNPKKRLAHVTVVRNLLKAVRPLYVYTYATPETLRERILRRGEKPELQPDSTAIDVLYRQMFELVGINGYQLLELDTTGDPDLNELVKSVEVKIQALNRRSYGK